MTFTPILNNPQKMLLPYSNILTRLLVHEFSFHWSQEMKRKSSHSEKCQPFVPVECHLLKAMSHSAQLVKERPPCLNSPQTDANND